MSETAPLVPSKKPWVAFLLSVLFPGLGHLYVGNRLAALIYGAMGLGVWISCYSSGSILTRLAVLLILPFVVIPAARDAFDTASGKKKPVTGEESKLYVIWMLCCVGPFALPLLWRNKKFSLTVKIIWTVVVVAVVVFFFAFIEWAGEISHDFLGI
ncbi:MAG TPA: hypothetical protein PLY88_07230 [Candidatus Omnitrophota bacterium]|nr:hypothetical protein [Candidatus Omnitrophota bacterium]